MTPQMSTTAPEDCTTCDGSGQLEEIDYIGDDGILHTVTYQCPTCAPRDELHVPIVGATFMPKERL